MPDTVLGTGECAGNQKNISVQSQTCRTESIAPRGSGRDEAQGARQTEETAPPSRLGVVVREGSRKTWYLR